MLKALAITGSNSHRSVQRAAGAGDIPDASRAGRFRAQRGRWSEREDLNLRPPAPHSN